MTKQYPIALNEQCKLKLNQLKTHPRESYGDVVEKLISEHEELQSMKLNGSGKRDLEGPNIEVIKEDTLATLPAGTDVNPTFEEAAKEATKRHESD